MDLVGAILRGCGCESSLASFKTQRIEYNDLKLLVKEDLDYLGIKDKSVQDNVIKNCQSLHSPRSRREFLIDGQYICLIANQISLQLRKHFANLSCTVKRRNIKICNIKLKPVSRCFQKSVTILDNNINYMEQVLTRNQKQKKFKMGCKSTAAAMIVLLIAIYLYFKK
ncbi:uncharacterized protein LOC143190682 [Rhynchophorus ferrugineus]|uniref:uncharacterized protein LOC143190682 n=1 Tax=Rhynchophorus ferrugineus TaxID=354439 RepID=UPI003FCD8D28